MTEFLQALMGGWTPPGRRSVLTSQIPVHLRAGFYTRYSTASQHDTSTERQSEDCHAYSKRMGFAVVKDGIYSDEERSGGYIVKHEALHALLERAQAGELDVVVIADPTRLSRDMVDLGWLWRKLARAGVALHAATRGPLAAADIALYGFLSQEQRQSIAANTAWGRRRMVADGRVPWGAFYGYRKVAGKRGEIEKDPEQAEVIMRIFELRIQGLSMRGIMEALNKDGIDGPGGRIWKIAGVNNVLNQPCYAGMIVYGRHKCETDPETGRKKYVRRDPAEWTVADVPHLRIVDPAVWQRVHTINAIDASERRGKRGPKKAYLLSGLVRCGSCGSNMIIRGSNRDSENKVYVCSTKESSSRCATKSSVNLLALERAVFSALHVFLSQPYMYLAYLRSLAVETNSHHSHLKQTRGILDRKIASLRSRLHKTFDDALTEGFSSRTLSELRTGIEEKLATFEAKLDALPKVRDDIDIEREVAGLGTLQEALGRLSSNGILDVRSVHGERLAAAIQALIDHVVATPIGESRGIQATVTLRQPAASGTRKSAESSQAWQITGSGYPPTRSEIWRKAGMGQVEQALASGNCILDDAAWKLIAHLVPEHHCATLQGDMRTPRALVDMLLLSSRLSRPFSDLPANYGPRWRLRCAVRSLKACGAWKAVCEVLSANAPRFLDGAISHIDFDAPVRNPQASRTKNR